MNSPSCAVVFSCPQLRAQRQVHESVEVTEIESSSISTKSVRVAAIAIGAIGVLIAAISVVSTATQTSAAHREFDASMTSMVHEVEADDNAHAALTSAESSDFETSAASTTTALTKCLGAGATAATTTELAQLAGFADVPGAPRVILPAIKTADSTEGYEHATAILQKALAAGRFDTKETEADTDADLIVQDEVARDLYAIATSVGGEAKTVTAKYVYAKKSTTNTYKGSVAAVADQVTALEPVLAPGKGGDLVSDTESTDLLSALGSFASECRAVAASSAAHKPALNEMFRPRLPTMILSTFVCTPGVMVNGIWVQYGYCTPVLK